MINYLKKRASKLQGLFGVYISFILDALLFYFAYENQLSWLWGAILLYLVIDKIIIPTKKKSISYHVYSGVITVLDDIQNRGGGVIWFYMVISTITYALSLYLINIHFFVGYICFALMMFLKVLVYFLCYGMSVKSVDNTKTK